MESKRYSALNVGLFGPPGSGKGTQAELLIRDFGFFHLAPGDLLRKAIKEQTELGRKAAAVINQGHLVDDETINEMMRAHMADILVQGGRILLDGYPRTLPQLDYVDHFFLSHGTALHGVFMLDISSESLVERLTGRRVCESCGAVYHLRNLNGSEGVCAKCGGRLIQRRDDNAEAILARFEVYQCQTFPVLQALEDQGRLARIDADQPLEDVYTDLAAHVRELVNPEAALGR